MPEIACTEPECTRGRIYRDNGMVGVCFRCSGRGTVHVDRHPLQDTVDGLRAELAEARAEIDRLRTVVPSKDEIAEIRYAFGCTDYRPKDALAWLTRIESAKENGR